MKRFFSLCLSALMIFSSIALVGCKSRSISMISSSSCGYIYPIDIYKVVDGYMYSTKSMEKKVELEKEEKYYAVRYSEEKLSDISTGTPLKINKDALKLSSEYIDYSGNYGYRAYTSKYWGSEEAVSFKTNVKFYKTYYLKFEEKSNTYKITYYHRIDDGSFFAKLDDLNEYKKIVEVPKDDIKKIEYFV